MVDENPDRKGVGPWVAKDKHRLLTDYLHGTRGAWKDWPKRVLIDPFCGPGRIRTTGETFTRDGGAVAAWREMQNDASPFTSVFVGDLDPAKSEACAARLRVLGANVRPYAGPAVETVPQMVAATPRGSLCMAYVDPYCLTLLDFEMLRTMATLKVDLAVHFSTMDLQRNVIIDLADERDNFERVAPGWKATVDLKTTGVANIRRAFSTTGATFSSLWVSSTAARCPSSTTPKAPPCTGSSSLRATTCRYVCGATWPERRTATCSKISREPVSGSQPMLRPRQRRAPGTRPSAALPVRARYSSCPGARHPAPRHPTA